MLNPKTRKTITLLLITTLILTITAPIITTTQSQNQLENMKNQTIITQIATTTKPETHTTPITKSIQNKIVVDGDPSDWIGVSPLVVDDTLETDDWLDVKTLYVTHDSSNLYLRIDSANAIPPGIFLYVFQGLLIFDVDNGKNSYTIHYHYQWQGDIIVLYDSSGQQVENPSFLQIAANSNILEIGVGLSDIGNPDQVDIMLQSENTIVEWLSPPQPQPPPPPYTFPYTIGRVVRSITVDGDYSDWSGIEVAITDEQGEINPSYLDLKYIFVANDGNELYVRMDTVSKPKTSISGTSGFLAQSYNVLFDTDRNKNTGYRGVEYEAHCGFTTSSWGNQPALALLKWNGNTWQEVVSASLSAALNDVFEFSIRLSDLEITSGETIDVSAFIGASLYDYVPDSGKVTYKVPSLRLGCYEVNKVNGGVHGELNLTAVWEPTSCSVNLEVMGPKGTTLYNETKSVSLPADTETTVLFDWACGDLPLGDYYARFRVRDIENSLVFDSGWFFGFSMGQVVYTYYSFGSIGPSSTVAWSEFLTLGRHQSAVFEFTLPSDLCWMDITLEGGFRSGFLVTVGNATLFSFRDVYLSPSTSDTWRIYNVPSGSYNVTIVSKSSSSLSKLNISTSSSLVKDIIIGDLRDSGGVRNQFSGLCGARRTYYLDVVYVTALREDISVSISNSSMGVSWSGTLKTSPFSTSRTATFQIDLEFPSQPYTSRVMVEAALQTSSVNDAKEMPFISIRQDYDIDLEYSVTTYFRVPSRLCFWDPHVELPMSESQLKALEVSNVRIVDVNLGSDGRIDNITVSFHVKNKYKSGALWWKYYVHYDLYVYPVRVKDTVIEKYVTGVVAGEQEDIEVSGIRVEYIGNRPTVKLRIIFEKSLLLNTLGWALEKVLGRFIPLAGSEIGRLAFMFTDELIDYFQSRVTVKDVKHIIAISSLPPSLLYKYYNIEDLSSSLEVLEDLHPMGLLMDIIHREPGIGWKIGGAIIKDIVLREIRNNPIIWEGILETLIKEVTGKTIKISLENVYYIAKEVLPFLDKLDTVVDAIVKLSAHDREIKEIYMQFSGPHPGTPSYPSFSDPLIRISFTGQTSESLSNYVRFYDVLRLRVEIARTGTDQGTVTITFTPFE
ncbi:MAG: hypothetical protein KIH08_14985, partial [Candidatus Freyarchaeota archaeon]|nr:hypothetical protein [Candidatus Jordarchaeia archaeon]